MKRLPTRTAWSTTTPPDDRTDHRSLTTWARQQPVPTLAGYELLSPTVSSTNYTGYSHRVSLRLSRQARPAGSVARGRTLVQDWVCQLWTAPGTGVTYAAHRWIVQPLGQTSLPLTDDYCPHGWLQARPLGWQLLGLSIRYPNDWVIPTPGDPQGCSVNTLALANQLGMIPAPDMSICAPLADALADDGHEDRARWVCEWYEDMTGKKLM